MPLPKQFYYKRNRLQQLKGFYHTVQTGSVSKAAEKMGLNQSTITLQIQTLERDLNQKLFDRDKKKIKPNKYGLMFYEMVARQLNGIDSLYEEFLRKKSQKLSKIRIAAHHVAISHLLPPFINKFQKKHPGIKVMIKNIPVAQAIKEMQDGEIDLILYPNVKISEEFYSHISFSYNPILIMHKDHELARKKKIANLQEISNYNIVRIEQELISLPLFEEVFKEFNFKTNIEFKNGSWEMVKNFVKENIGVGFVSRLYLTKDDVDLSYIDLDNHFPKMNYDIITKNGSILGSGVKDFIEIMTR